MKQRPLLPHCTITGLPATASPLFGPLTSSLDYQSVVLGMAQIAPRVWECGHSLSFGLLLPDASPITCEISGWPDSAAATTEFTLQAACGLMSVHGRASGRMQPLGVNYVSTLAATLALQGALACALGMRRGVPCERVSTSLASAGMLAVGQYLAGATALESPEKILPGSSSTTERPPFVSADGVVFELETLDAPPWRSFWSEIGVDMESAGKGWNGFLLRYAKAVAPLPATLIDALARLPYARIAEVCAHTGVAICPVRSLQERAADIDAHPLWRRGPWAFTSETGESAPYGSNRATGPLPLSGMTVIESCRRIQGPLAGHLLAMLGATVIRIEPPGGDPLRGVPPIAEGVSARFDALNRSKIVREIDIKAAHGRAEIHALAREADVFLHNWAPGKAAALQLDSADLRRINPALVYAYAGGWGDGEQALPGTDFVVQAYSGIAHKIARASHTDGGSLFTVLDVLGGAVAAQGVTAALLSRSLLPAGLRMESSLLGAASLLCTEDLDALLHSRETLPSDSVLQAVYPTRQGWLALDCPDARTMAALAGAAGLSRDVSATELHARLPEALSSKTASEWLAVLEPLGIPASLAPDDLSELRDNPRLAAGLVPGSYTRVNSPWSFQ
ncbi:CoA transferase [Ralstonia insidiosa]|jgi:CoA:oxalate CoA-transferase|uniref:Carnitine dehydratase n=1 Tax=Ralstonia insidiosa TaxID=190721 RepID=A0A191ZWG7_9RALS|nr:MULTISPECIES: CoA transferase [Ralstonia]ANJ72421.1 carnitine dehydratase [Ralstonia insidiosa]KAB0472965.1 carnitine dehydratase [Ralstonia insidiosa]MBY4907402.1 CoA transferase [Ralstonia insidiosa]